MREFRSSNTSLDGVIQADLMMAFIGPVLADEAPKGWFD
ncbi:conserved hypothetical protein [Mesorhizobium escarrei]|uniref:Uncharacterized protein n=1 Tax=Mesorhizobium escarrei TaxID=666018 RepID=A0ABM9EAG9_9HYPH|nr:conserved hypothetical protein [Mesorhizobium escarrei]